MTTIDDLQRRGHSHRNYDPSEFIGAYRQAGYHKRADLREQLKLIDDGRFHEMLDAAHNVFAHLDRAGRKQFAENNSDWLLKWIAVFGLCEDLNTFPEYTGVER